MISGRIEVNLLQFDLCYEWNLITIPTVPIFFRRPWKIEIILIEAKPVN